MVLVEIVVYIVERMLALMTVQVNGVRIGDVGGLKCAGHLGHELTEYADTVVPKGRLR